MFASVGFERVTHVKIRQEKKVSPIDACHSVRGERDSFQARNEFSPHGIA